MEKCKCCGKEKPVEQMLYLRLRNGYVCNFKCADDLAKKEPLTTKEGFLFTARLPKPS